MRIKLCIDIWRDVFDFLSTSDRNQIAQKSNRINDREFSDLLQKWLHEWTKDVCLGSIVIGSTSDGDKKSAQLRCLGKNGYVNFPFAEVEMPDNIRDFTWFHIRYLDSTVISFLQRMQPLLHDKVNFDVHNFGGSEQSFEAMSTALDHLIPLLNGGIETFSLAYTDLLLYIRDHFPAQLFGVKLLDVWFGFAKPTAELTESLLEWLVTQRQDSQPRMLMLRAYEYAAWVIEFIERIRQQLITANCNPVNFLLICFGSFENIQESTTHNSGTNEQLVVIRKWDGRNLLIGRCPSDVDGQKWVEEMVQEARETEAQTERRKIRIADLKLGPNEEAELEEKEKSEEDVDEPGPSNKKPKLI